MRMNLLHFWHALTPQTKHHVARDARSHENLKYGTMLVLGVPAVVAGSMYLVETLFYLLVR